MAWRCRGGGGGGGGGGVSFYPIAHVIYHLSLGSSSLLAASSSSSSFSFSSSSSSSWMLRYCVESTTKERDTRDINLIIFNSIKIGVISFFSDFFRRGGFNLLTNFYSVLPVEAWNKGGVEWRAYIGLT